MGRVGKGEGGGVGGGGGGGGRTTILGNTKRKSEEYGSFSMGGTGHGITKGTENILSKSWRVVLRADFFFFFFLFTNRYSLLRSSF